MNVDYFLASLIIFITLLKISKYLKAMSATFTVPSSSDFAMTVALLSMLIFSKVVSWFVLSMVAILSAFLSKMGHGGYAPLLLKVVGYTLVLFMLPYVSYEMYSYVQALATGFLYLTPETIQLITITFIILIIVALYDKHISYSLFDPEFSELTGIKPKLWISIMLFLSVLVGFTMTFMYGFLIAHIIALSTFNVRNKRLALITFILSVLALTNLPSALAVALGSVVAFAVDKMLLLWKSGSKDVSYLWKAFMRGPPRMPSL